MPAQSGHGQSNRADIDNYKTPFEFSVWLTLPAWLETLRPGFDYARSLSRQRILTALMFVFIVATIAARTVD